MKLQKLKTSKFEWDAFDIFQFEGNLSDSRFQYKKDERYSIKKYIFIFNNKDGDLCIVGDKNETFKDLKYMFMRAFGNL